MALLEPEAQLREWLHAGGVEEEADVERLIKARVPGASWVAAVLNSGLVDEPRFMEALARSLGIEFLDVHNDTPERNVLDALPSRLVFLHALLPISRKEGVLTIAHYSTRYLIGRVYDTSFAMSLKKVQNQILRFAVVLAIGIARKDIGESLRVHYHSTPLLPWFQPTKLSRSRVYAWSLSNFLSHF